MLIKIVLALTLSYSIFGVDIQETLDTHAKEQLIIELKAEIKEAKEAGTAETMDIVEKIKYVRNLEEELNIMEHEY